MFYTRGSVHSAHEMTSLLATKQRYSDVCDAKTGQKKINR